MLFRLRNALARFQKYINNIIAKKLNIFIIVYLDNIFIYINYNKNSHIIVVWRVLE